MNRNAKRKDEVTAMNGSRGIAMTWALLAGGLLAAAFAAASIPEPDHIFYGPLPEGAESVLVTIESHGIQVASYAVGPSAGGHYVLRLPIDSIEERSPGTVRPGDEATFLVDGARAAAATVGEAGSVRFLDLSTGEGGDGISIHDVTVIEGDDGTVDAVFEVTLGRVRDRRVVVYWETEDGTAFVGEDFETAASGRATLGAADRSRTRTPHRVARRVAFAPGEESASIVLPVICDLEPEGDETFIVRLVRAIGASLDRETATGTIVDDDGSKALSILVAGSRVVESDAASAGVSVRLSRAFAEEVSVDWTTVNGLAAAGEDFAADGGTLTFPAGETSRWIGVRILDDAEPEPDEQFLIAFSQPVNAVLEETEAVLTILDDDGEAGPELGRARVGRAPRRVKTAHAFGDPVVILGPAAGRGAQIALDGVGGDGFDVVLHGAGDAAEEEVSYLVVERGTHVMPDGSVWEAGTFELETGGTWTPRAFAQTFHGVPSLMLAVQDAPGDPAAGVRARSVGTGGFEAAAFGMNGEVSVVGYLAVHSAAGSGTLAIGGEPTPYLLQRPEVAHRATPVLGWSAGAELPPGVAAVPLEVLALGRHLFVRQAGDGSGGPVAVHARPPQHGAPLEWGAVSDVGRSWTTVPLAGDYRRPVLVATSVVASGGTPSAVRVRNVTGSAFEVSCEPWLSTGSCDGTRVSYLLVEEGTHDVAGLEIRAGTLETGRRVSDGWQEVAFGSLFAQEPVVLVGLQTRNNPGMRARIHNRNADWFDLALESRAGADAALVPETVGWIAVEPGRAVTADGRRIQAFTLTAGSSTAPAGRASSLPPVPGDDVHRSRSADRRRMPCTRSSELGSTKYGVTLAGAGSTYFAAPSLIYQGSDGAELAAVVPGGEPPVVAEDICIVRAD